MKLDKLSALMVLGGLAIGSAHAGMVSDADGNVGFDTAAECDAAVLSGKARFYAPQTKMPALKRSGEKAVSVSTLGQVDALYSRGACDIGVGRANNRNGVSANLRGKYVPFSPSMPVNAYTDASGKVVRVSMAQCDNRFSENMPRPVPAPAVVAAAPAPAPAPAVVAPAPAPAPVMAAPVVAPKAAPVAAPVFRMTPYLFGTVGIQRDLIGNAPIAPFGAQADDHAHALALQGGVGYQLSPQFGAEIFAQGGRELTFENGVSTKTRALGIRGTAGHDFNEALRVFGKLGFARVTHSGGVPSQSETRPTLGLGISYDINSNLAVRGDFDHFVKKSGSNWKALNYIGVGLQYNFMP